MRDDDPMAVTLSTQLERLSRERERLEELLMLDANWRALREIEQREADADDTVSFADRAAKAELVMALATNRIYAARAKLVETMELLAADHLPGALPEPASLSSRIVMLSEPSGETFRARLRMKPAEVAAAPAPRPAAAPKPPEPPNPHVAEAAARATVEPQAAALPDALELIDGLGRCAVEQLLDGGVTRFDDIARWTHLEAAAWRTRLEGLAHGSSGWWIEQAAVLATGRLTHFAGRARRGEFAALVPPPEPEPPRPWSPEPEAVLEPTPAAKPDAALEPAGTETPAPILEDVQSSDIVAPAVPPPLDTVRHVTAEELARTLAAAAPAPPPLPVEIVLPLDDATIIETIGQRQQDKQPAKPHGYIRPRHRETAGMPEPALADGVAAIKPTEARNGTDRPRTLLRRLKDLSEPERFQADTYAGYQGSVEEASVTIVPAIETASTPNGAAGPAKPNGGSEPPTRNRFLKALTGKP